MDKESSIKSYKEYKEKTQLKYKKQADFFRCELGIDSVEKAVDFMRKWIDTQTFDSGEMKGCTASVMLTCAILSEAIDPNDSREIAMTESNLGWDIYHSLKENNLW